MDGKQKWNGILEQLKDTLTNAGVKKDVAAKIEQQVAERMSQEQPPTVAIIGFTGVGKSTTLNALFNAGQPTSDFRPCTKEAAGFTANLKDYTGSKGTIKVYDMPGLGESIHVDERYYAIYADILPKADVIIWLFHAGDRAMTPMQAAMIRLINMIGPEFTKRLLFAVNKADAIAPGESTWNTKFNIPSDEQAENLKEFAKYVQERVFEVLPDWSRPVVLYSAKRRYHLEQLMTAMVECMPEKRKWVMDGLADVAAYEDLIDPEYRAYIEQLRNQKPRE